MSPGVEPRRKQKPARIYYRTEYHSVKRKSCDIHMNRVRICVERCPDLPYASAGAADTCPTPLLASPSQSLNVSIVSEPAGRQNHWRLKSHLWSLRLVVRLRGRDASPQGTFPYVPFFRGGPAYLAGYGKPAYLRRETGATRGEERAMADLTPRPPSRRGKGEKGAPLSPSSLPPVRGELRSPRRGEGGGEGLGARA